MSDLAPPILRFDKLPAELISSIIYFAQIAWHNEHFAAQAPYVGVKRYQVSEPASVSAPPSISPCCNGTRWDSSRPICIRSDSGKALPPHLPSPAHSASLVSRKLRDALIDESRIWKLDNTLYPAIANLSGEHRTTSSGRQVIQYGARSLIALDVCICVLAGISPFYSSLERVKLRLPWLGDGSLLSELRQFLRDVRGRADSPLRYFDLEALVENAFRVAARGHWRVTAIESENLRSSRFSGGNLFYYSRTLQSLYLHQGPNSNVVFFGSSLSIALSACSVTIEFLTIDIAGGVAAELEDSVAFPKLRHFRLCMDSGFATLLLCWMVLPYALDLHLELVEFWRKSFTTKHPGVYEVPFWPSMYAPPVHLLWRRPQDFAQSLYQPHCTSTIAHPGAAPHPAHVGDPAESLWQRSIAVMGLDVRLDPSIKANEPVAARFPELVSISLAESVEALVPVARDPVGRDWQGSQELEGKIAARRSLTFRDGQFTARRRERDFNNQYPKALYDTLRYVLNAVPGPSTTGFERRVEVFVFAKDSWLPDRSLAYQHILERFISLRSILFDSAPLADDAHFRQNMEGCLAFAHLDALALYLNSPGPAGAYPCPALEVIRIAGEPALPPIDDGRSRAEAWDTFWNSAGRLACGVPRIRLTENVRLVL
ncbi:unnamed protein product [Peniophora sp. CBMAI 1063]|nr:unnamed protein product [Peniophora sp. CBMAI 1063]